LIARYDAQATFASTSAWSTFDVATKDSTATGFRGSAFDGRYLYLIPTGNGPFARFDAKQPPSIPASFHGSNL
jgi:hypothetical protein